MNKALQLMLQKLDPCLQERKIGHQCEVKGIWTLDVGSNALKLLTVAWERPGTTGEARIGEAPCQDPRGLTPELVASAAVPMSMRGHSDRFQAKETPQVWRCLSSLTMHTWYGRGSSVPGASECFHGPD
ncbi:hypothetical protein AAY473_006775 [Plecturocebus cupreus]